MKRNWFIIGLFLLMIASCQQTKKSKSYNESRELIPNPEGYQKDSLLPSKTDNCDFDQFLEDSKTPKIALELYNETFLLKEGDPSDLLKKLDLKDNQERSFYFKVITNSYQISDGAYSEALGYYGKEYVETKTKEFATYFDNSECFTNDDLKTWTKIVLLEFQIILENEADNNAINKYIATLQSHCADGSVTQKKTINKFGKLLKTEWENYLKNTAN